MTAAPEHAAPPRRRSRSLDGLRGLAVALMVLDHLLLAFPVDGGEVRGTLTRAAMPLFFVLAGHLATRVSWRLVNVVAVGLVLEVVAPWAGPLELLSWLAVGAVLVRVARRDQLALVGLVAFGLTLGANGFAAVTGTGGYDPRLLVALMALGALVPRADLECLGRLVRGLAPLGRYPLSVYAGHLLLLEALRVSL